MPAKKKPEKRSLYQSYPMPAKKKEKPRPRSLYLRCLDAAEANGSEVVALRNLLAVAFVIMNPMQQSIFENDAMVRTILEKATEIEHTLTMDVLEDTAVCSCGQWRVLPRVGGPVSLDGEAAWKKSIEAAHAGHIELSTRRR